MSEPKLSSGSGGIRHIQNPIQRHKELGVTNHEQVYDETPIVIPGLGVLGIGVKQHEQHEQQHETKHPSARVLKRRRFRAQRKQKRGAT